MTDENKPNVPLLGPATDVYLPAADRRSVTAPACSRECGRPASPDPRHEGFCGKCWTSEVRTRRAIQTVGTHRWVEANGLVGAYKNPDRSARNKHMRRLRAERWTLAGLALAFGVTAPTVDKVVADIDVDPVTGSRVDRSRAVRRMIAEGRSVIEVASLLGQSESTVRSLAWGQDHDLAERSRRVLRADLGLHRSTAFGSPLSVIEEMAVAWWLIGCGGREALAT